jgi:hypothetical protein
MPVEELAKHLRAVLAEAQGWVPADVVHFELTQRLNGPVADAHFDAARDWLLDRDLAAQNGANLRYSEHDCLERDTYGPLVGLLMSNAVLSQLHLSAGHVIIEPTHEGGANGTGQWSRPDFTIATIRQWQYDPQRHLDLIAFEVKNRQGSNVAAVFEALAHQRFAHYACVVLPSLTTTVATEMNRSAAIEGACKTHGIGLFLFDLIRHPIGGRQITNLRIKIAPERRATDPNSVERFINDRFSPANREALRAMAQQ